MSESTSIQTEPAALGVSSRRLTIALYSAAVFLFWMAQYVYLPTLPTCIPAVLAVQSQARGEEAMGVKVVVRALQEPFRRIATNAGVDAPGAVMAQMQKRGPVFGYDAVKRQIVSMEKDGILDPAGVLTAALQTAVSGAMMALTTETMVLKRNPQTSMEP